MVGFGLPAQAHNGCWNGTMLAVDARLMPLLARFRAIWGGLAGTGAGSSISCRCESLVAANPSMLMLGGSKKCGYGLAGTQCVLYPADWDGGCSLALTTPIGLPPGPVAAQSECASPGDDGGGAD